VKATACARDAFRPRHHLPETHGITGERRPTMTKIGTLLTKHGITLLETEIIQVDADGGDSETRGGLLVHQDGRAYIARGWRLNKETRQLIKACLEAGFVCMIQDGHPRTSNQLPICTKGVIKLSFSISPQHRWSIAVESAKNGTDYRLAVLNKLYEKQIESSRLCKIAQCERRNTNKFEIDKDDFIPALPDLAKFDHDVLLPAGNR